MLTSQNLISLAFNFRHARDFWSDQKLTFFASFWREPTSFGLNSSWGQSESPQKVWLRLVQSIWSIAFVLATVSVTLTWDGSFPFLQVVRVLLLLPISQMLVPRATFAVKFSCRWGLYSQNPWSLHKPESVYAHGRGRVAMFSHDFLNSALVLAHTLQTELSWHDQHLGRMT